MFCGLLGQKLAHSYSTQIHAELGDYTYRLIEKEPEELDAFFRERAFNGINVTIPYKKTVIPYCAELTPRAKKIGAVNTIVRRPDGSLIGHNTDYFGFEVMFRSLRMDIQGKKALVLGSGGASNTACAVLEEKGAQVVVISRHGENNYTNLDRHKDAALIVNATPVGMYPNTGVSPIDLTPFPNLEAVADVIYNPAKTQFLLDAEARGLKTANGLIMLVAQAKESAEWFTGKSIDSSVIPQCYHRLKLHTENTVLIGMPGCGKSSVGQLLAKLTGKTFVDADAEIEQRTGMTIPEFFAQKGEPAFRELETQVLADLGKRSATVLATGGGCVTREENYPLLHENGTVIWLRRDLSKLPTKGRPLSQAGSLAEMYRVREPMYAHFADAVVDNNGSLEETAAAIQRILGERA